MDNAGVLYSAIQKERYSAVYRFSALMTKAVDPQALQRAVQKTMPRFPGFGVRIRRGAFWCYFEPNPNPGPFVKPDMANPCQPLRFHEDNDWLIRILYYEKRISVEVFHAISDGAGTLVFLRTLLAVYLRELGFSIPNGPGILDVTAPPRKRKSWRTPMPGMPAAGRCGASWKRPPSPNTSAPRSLSIPSTSPWGWFRWTGCGRLQNHTKQPSQSILPQFFSNAFLENQAARRFRHPQPVALAIPINLRPWFPSETLRNFILTMRPCIDPTLGEYTLPEIVRQVHSYMHLHANRQEMQAKLTGNVQFTKNHFLQIIPLALKNPVMAFSYKLVGVRPYSGTYTNPGAFPVPRKWNPTFSGWRSCWDRPPPPPPHCASISYGNTMAITFAGTGVSSETERRFFFAI